MVRQFNQMLKFFWGTVAALIVGVALFIQLGRLVLPYAEHWNESIETYAARELGLTVTIGQLGARWEGLSPELTVTDFVLWSEEEAALRVGEATVQLRLLNSLRAGEWRFGQLRASAVELVLEQADNGRFALLGFSAPEQSKRLSFNPLTLSQRVELLQSSAISAQFRFLGGEEREFRLTGLQLGNDREFHRLQASLELPDRPETLKLIYEGRGVSGQPEYGGRGYLSLSDYPLAHPLAFASGNWAQAIGVREGFASLESWFTVTADKVSELSGEFSYRNEESENRIPDTITASFSGFWRGGRDWLLGIRDLRGLWQGRESLTTNFTVSPASDEVQVRADQFDLGYWSRHLLQIAVLPEKAQDILSTLEPRGNLRNLQLSLPSDEGASQFSLRAEMDDVSVSPWLAAPGIQHLDGYLEAGLNHGRVQIDTPGPLTFHMPKLFAVPIDGKGARGEVAWHIDKGSNQVLVNSGLLSVESEYGDVNGYFYLDAPFVARSRKNQIFLQLGLQGGDVRNRGELVPRVVPDNVRSWINQGLIGGKVPEVAVVVQGMFGPADESPEDTPPRSIQVAASFDDLRLAYLPQWPDLKQARGRMYLNTDALLVRLHEAGYLSSTRLEKGILSLRRSNREEGYSIGLSSEFKGGVQDGMQVLTGTPLRQQLGGAFDSWQVSGDMVGSLTLEIPLGAGVDAQSHEVAVQIQDATLLMTDLNLPMQQLSGALHYSSREGLTSQELAANLWGKPVSASITSAHYNDDQPKESRVKLQGMVDLQDMAHWLSRPELLFLDGEAEFKGQALIRAEESSLQFTSDLRGVEISLPAPFGKSAQAPSALDIEVPLQSEKVSVAVNYADRLFADFSFPRNGDPVASVSLMEDLPVRQSGFWIQGKLSQLDAPLWLEVYDRYEAYMNGFGDSQRARGIPSISSAGGGDFPLLQLDLDVAVVDWGEQRFETVTFSGGQETESWRIHWLNEVVAGSALFEVGTPPSLELDWLRWPASDSDADSGNDYDPLAELDPRGLPAMSLSIAEFRVGEKQLGRWSMRLQPLEHGLLVDQIMGDIGGARIHGTQSEVSAPEGESVDGARLSWFVNAGGHATEVEATLEGEDLADVTDALGLPRTIESRSARLVGDLGWDGSPLKYSTTALRGTLGMDLREGRFQQAGNQAGDALLRLVGLFNFDNWARRLKLDFSDVYKGGTSFDLIRGDLRFDQGMVYLDEPVAMKNASSRMLLGGSINLLDETLDASLVATLPVGGNATLLTALIAGLPAAAGVYVASKVFEKQMDRAATFSYDLSGPWADPKVEFDTMFDTKAADKASEKSRSQGAAPSIADEPAALEAQ